MVGSVCVQHLQGCKPLITLIYPYDIVNGRVPEAWVTWSLVGPPTLLLLSVSFHSPHARPVVLTVLTHNPAPRVQLGKDAVLDLRFAYAPSALEGSPSLDAGPPPFGLEWRRQHRGKGHLLLAATPGLAGRMPPAQEKATAFAAWDDDEPWGPWTGNGTFWLPAVKPSQEGVYLATVHLPYLQGQVSLELTVHSESGNTMAGVILKTVGSPRHLKALTWDCCEVLTGRQSAPCSIREARRPTEGGREVNSLSYLSYSFFRGPQSVSNTSTRCVGCPRRGTPRTALSCIPLLPCGGSGGQVGAQRRPRRKF